MRKLVLWSCCVVSKTLENVSERKLLRTPWIIGKEIKRNFEHSSSGQMRVDKLRAGVVRITCPNQNAESTLKLRPLLDAKMSKSLRRCGAKHVSKLKSTKHYSISAPLEVERKHMSKWKCTKQIRSRDFWKLRCRKNLRCCAANRFPKIHRNTSLSEHFWKLRCRKNACGCGTKHISKSKCTKHITPGTPVRIQMWSCSRTHGFVACPETMAGVVHVKRIWKDEFRMAGAV